MDSQNKALFNESILLERTSVEFYWLLMNHFPNDAAFWANLKSDEENHAKILLDGRDYFLKKSFFPIEGFEPDLVKIQKTNSILEEFMRIYKQNPPAPRDAFKIALMMEAASVEHYFRLSLDLSPATTTDLTLLRSLTDNEMNHAKRITDRFTWFAHLEKQKNDLRKDKEVTSSIKIEMND